MARQRHLSRAARARLAASLAVHPAAEEPRKLAVLLCNTLTLNQWKYVVRYVETGNARQSVLDAGYRCKSARSADDIAQELQANPRVQYVKQALLEARGWGTEKLDQILARFVSRFDSANGGDRSRALKGLDIAYKRVVPRPPVGADAKPLPEALFNEMSEAELQRYIERQEWPAWATDRLRRAGFSLRRSDAATTLDEIPGAPPADPPAGAGSVDDDARAGDGESADRSAPGGDPGRGPTDAQAPPPARPPRAPEPDQAPPPPLAASAPNPSGQGAEPHAWQRPEDRVFASRRPAPEPPAPQPSSGPAADASALDATDPIAEAKRAAVLHALATRDRRW
jgi:hypothetical protein